uniref:Uncharacterized protein n=1 Tax=mine drainage metagenome TaxID=410659 RepID=E6QN49_9ZZZZ
MSRRSKPESSRSRPAMSRSRELFPAPDGPKKTVSGASRWQASSMRNGPRWALRSSSSMVVLTGARVEGDEGDEAKREQQTRGAVGGGVVKVLDLVEKDDGESAGGAGDVSAKHEDYAELAEGVEKTEQGGGEDGAAGERQQKGAGDADGTSGKQARRVEQCGINGGKARDQRLYGEGKAVKNRADDQSREGKSEGMAEQGSHHPAGSGARAEQDEQIVPEDGWRQNQRQGGKGLSKAAQAGAAERDPGSKGNGQEKQNGRGDGGEF